MSSFTRPHNYYDNPPSEASRVTNIDLITISLAFATVVLRCYTKFLLIHAPWWDDYTCIIALIVAIGRTAVDFVGQYQFGAGRHFWDIPPEYYNGFLTTIAVDGYLYIVAITFAKLSLLLFLYRIFHVDKRFRIAAWVTGGILSVWATVAVLLAIFACRPVAASWNLKLMMDPNTRCEPKAYNTENVYGFCNVITDVVLIIMPMPLVWHMQMDRKKKLGILLVFATGAFVCAVAIVRQYFAYNPSPSPDISHEILEIKMWMALEVNIAIIVACLPALTPLFKRIPVLASLIPSSSRSRFSHASAMQRAPWPQKLSGPRHDVEMGGKASTGHVAHGSWQVPRAWREAERRAFGSVDEQSEHSGVSGQSREVLYHVR
ncbi:MAG: hypothetical protein Q9219_001578 [cf. Caloplaca sp. 3 TL-2023]